ncbi:MAG: hypothetical protein HKN23_13375 [Verrucomicrobiales bacterium]|nr:hypothetical protein [Verrucomicrobiales bacterium]
MTPRETESAQNLRVLETATDAPETAYESDDDVRSAFDDELRQLAEEIVQHHPSLTQLLLSLSDADQNPIQGRN